MVKNLFFHLLDMLIVNSIILFRDHKRQFPDREGLRRTVKYGVTSSRAEAVRKLCSFPEYDRPPLHDLPKPTPPPHLKGCVRPFIYPHLLKRGEIVWRVISTTRVFWKSILQCTTVHEIHASSRRQGFFCDVPLLSVPSWILLWGFMTQMVLHCVLLFHHSCNNVSVRFCFYYSEAGAWLLVNIM